MKKILVIGAFGQVGSELVPALRKKYGKDNVVAAWHSKEPDEAAKSAGPTEKVDATKKESIEAVLAQYNIDTIYHLASILSAAGEKNPQLAYFVNNACLYNVLEVAHERRIERVMVPSSIAVFGPDTPRDNTPNETILKPSTMYGISKVHGELLANYYFNKFGVDVRGVRFPGIISNVALPGGGTTDYAVDIFYHAVKHKPYTCFLSPESTLPMMYMPDALKAIIQLAEADVSNLKHHADYNLAAFSFSPAELAATIQEELPDFTIDYKPDFRQAIADSWPRSIDDACARREWGWKPDYTLKAMVKDMIDVLSKKL
ncbi:MAG: NAD-dependent epimerase/dehydratase family protein [Candidatus Burarchaeum sp.]|nr:NAD-dependent epimerase/dehydratase family protein [Candidatus Burarchaeum sp.]MDO8339793.1 NAD-dependent epimerase/dehydratase family protein [Candidatus Burarchaeum sp.]